MFVVKKKSDGFYLTNTGSTGNIQGARQYKRKCDATNSARHHFDCTTRRYMWGDDFEVIPLLSPPAKLFPNHKITLARFDMSLADGWQDIVIAADKAQAEKIKADLVKKLHCHPDYIVIKETYEPPTNVHAAYSRPSWDDYLLGLAFAVSRRSHDAQTQHGCVIVDKDHRILGTGYNGFPRGLDDTVLPNIRPGKYDWMIHSEINALANCSVKPYGGICYLTGEPCNPCLMNLHQHGIVKVICGAKYCWQKDSHETRAIFDKFVKLSGIELVYADPDLSWINKLSDHINEFRKRKN